MLMLHKSISVAWYKNGEGQMNKAEGIDFPLRFLPMILICLAFYALTLKNCVVTPVRSSGEK